MGSLSLLQGISHPRSPTFQVDSLPTELSGKPMKMMKEGRIGYGSQINRYLVNCFHDMISEAINILLFLRIKPLCNV